MSDPDDIRDLSDFCMKWPDLRPQMTDAALAGAGLPERQRQIVGWLCVLAEKHCAFEE